MKQRCSLVAVFLCLAGLSVASATALQVPLPFDSCIDFHCDVTRAVTLEAGDWQAVHALFAGETSASGERDLIRQAIALLEHAVGVITGTSSDLARNTPGAGRQLDCIAESKNTSTYLHLLFNDGLLSWHKPEKREVRHPLIFGTHWTAVIRDRSSGQRYAVDSWFLDNGKPPYIQPLDDWLSGHPVDRVVKQVDHR